MNEISKCGILENASIVPQPKMKKRYLNYLRAVAMILVVMHHSLFYGTQYFSPSNIYLFIIDFVSLIHVPLFFMISGYLCREQPKLQYYKKKSHSTFNSFFLFFYC